MNQLTVTCDGEISKPLKVRYFIIEYYESKEYKGFEILS